MPKHALSPDLIDHYQVEGYVVVERLFSRDDLGPVEAAILELTARALESPEAMKDILELVPTGEPVPRRIFNPYDQHEAFNRLANDPRLVDAIESLIGPDINLQHSKLN